MRLFTYLRCASASWLLVVIVALNSMAQNIGETPKVALQPLAQHVRQVQDALSFVGKDDLHSKPDELMHYDLEVSGFPSSHAGHLVLLGLTEQDYREKFRQGLRGCWGAVPPPDSKTTA